MLKTKQHPAARRIVSLLEEPKEVYASLLIAGTFINICIIVLSNFLINQAHRMESYTFLEDRMILIFELLIRVFIIAVVLVFIGEGIYQRSGPHRIICDLRMGLSMQLNRCTSYCGGLVSG